jgi:hypothetical protein
MTVNYASGRDANRIILVMSLVVTGVSAWMALLVRHEDPGNDLS